MMKIEFISYEFEGDGQPILNVELRNGVLFSQDIGDSGHDSDMARNHEFYADGYFDAVKMMGADNDIDVSYKHKYVAMVDEILEVKKEIEALLLWNADMEASLEMAREWEEQK